MRFVVSVLLVLASMPSRMRTTASRAISAGWSSSTRRNTRKIRDRGERVIIDGICNSACTLVLGIVPLQPHLRDAAGEPRIPCGLFRPGLDDRRQGHELCRHRRPDVALSDDGEGLDPKQGRPDAGDEARPQRAPSCGPWSIPARTSSIEPVQHPLPQVLRCADHHRKLLARKRAADGHQVRSRAQASRLPGRDDRARRRRAASPLSTVGAGVLPGSMQPNMNSRSR